jgi:competence protein ComFC
VGAMRTISPIEIKGNWKKGYALAPHLISSTLTGYYEDGTLIFDNVRSDMGELIFLLKYRNGDNNIVSQIVDLAIPYIRDVWKISNEIDFIIPVPPSNTSRKSQPVFGICDALGKKLSINVEFDVLKKTTKTQLKGKTKDEKMEALKDSIKLNRTPSKPMNILLVDDLYESGLTLTECTKVLYSHSNIKNVYVLTMTKNKNSY